ncbi:MAG TPA: hypothetical protein DHW64_09845, partial [Chitinophagaceae bacterium]|nr:hypothetical protein [Chitinophagaceae bacterium]
HYGLNKEKNGWKPTKTVREDKIPNLVLIQRKKNIINIHSPRVIDEIKRNAPLLRVRRTKLKFSVAIQI